MQNRRNLFKATICDIIVAFFIVIIISHISIKFGKDKFLMAINIIDMITIKSNAESEKITPVLETFIDNTVNNQNIENEKTILLNKPDYGKKYGTLKIDSIGLELPLYYGKTLDILKNGIGHDNDSYFPGEGGSIVLMGHNFKKFLSKLPNAKIGDTINIGTNYGEFNYVIYDAKIVNEEDTDKVPIQDKEEILMIYTCWPINNIGYATERYVVYAK